MKIHKCNYLNAYFTTLLRIVSEKITGLKNVNIFNADDNIISDCPSEIGSRLAWKKTTSRVTR